MARSELTITSLGAITANGTNLTDATFTTLSTGSGNGVYFDYDSNDLVVLKNDTGGAAVFTLVLVSPTSITDIGGSLTNPTVSVANGKTHVLRLTDALKQTDGDAYIDCYVAGKILVLNL